MGSNMSTLVCCGSHGRLPRHSTLIASFHSTLSSPSQGGRSDADVVPSRDGPRSSKVRRVPYLRNHHRPGAPLEWSGAPPDPTRPDPTMFGSLGVLSPTLLWEGTTMSHRSSASIWSRPSERYSVTCNTNSIQMQGTHKRASLAPPAECQAGRRSKHGVPNKRMGPTGQPEGGAGAGRAS